MLKPRFFKLAAVMAGGAVLTGCGGAPMPMDSTQVVVWPLPSLTEQPAKVAVDWVRLDDHSVIIRVDGYRHTLSAPARHGPTVIHHNHVEQPRPSAHKTPPPEKSTTSTKQMDANDGRPAYADTPEALAAWKAWCSGNGRSMSSDEFALVEGSRLPSDVTFSCNESRRMVWRK